MNNKFTEYNLPVNAYASFDAQSLRRLIIDRLNNNSDITFTDQNFEGSNLGAIIDILGYTYHTLLFYLNQTSNESMFSEAELFENMNRIVKIIGYNPIGRQTSILPITLNSTANLSKGFYTIPRFSFINENGKKYSFAKDITFEKTQTGAQTLSAIKDNNFLYQGSFEEYPLQTAIGEDFEIINLLPGEQAIVDHFNINVFVRDSNDNTWYEYNQVPTLFLSNPNERVFEARFNHNKNYEIKFGNNVNGKRLNAGDRIAIYYLRSDGNDGKVSKNYFNNTQLHVYNTTRYDTIFNTIKDSTLNYLTLLNAIELSVSNTEDSTDYSIEESVEDIRHNAPKIFSTEYKLITKGDYETFVKSVFKNLVYDIKVSNNKDYNNIFLKYLTNELELTTYKQDSTALYNQYQFADSCNSNNLYLTIVPKIKKNNSVVTRSNYLSPALKQEILNELKDYQIITADVSFIDPVYLTFDIGIKDTDEIVDYEIGDCCELVIEKDPNILVSNDDIITKGYNSIVSFVNSIKLGDLLDIQKLNNTLLSIKGVSSIYTQRIDSPISRDGLNAMLWNPIYRGVDLKFLNTNYKLKYFQIPYIADNDKLRNKIVIR